MKTFEDIKKANESILTIDVKGKEYAQVNERIKAFRMLYPEGTIETEIVSNENGVCVIKAIVSTNILEVKETGEVIEHKTILGTGHAYEKEGSTFINKTSYVENCETSAVGRALGMAGIGIDTSVCSAEEVQNAIAQQNEPIEDKAKLIEKLQELIVETESDYEEVKKYYKVKSDKEFTIAQLKEAIKILEKKVK